MHLVQARIVGGRPPRNLSRWSLHGSAVVFDTRCTLLAAWSCSAQTTAPCWWPSGRGPEPQPLTDGTYIDDNLFFSDACAPQGPLARARPQATIVFDHVSAQGLRVNHDGANRWHSFFSLPVVLASPKAEVAVDGAPCPQSSQHGLQHLCVAHTYKHMGAMARPDGALSSEVLFAPRQKGEWRPRLHGQAFPQGSRQYQARQAPPTRPRHPRSFSSTQ